jgi:hypothetical protein
VKYNRTKLSTVDAGMSLLSESAQLVGSAMRNGFRLVTGRHTSTHDLLLNRFVDAIQSGGPSPVPAEDGRETVRVLDMIVKKLDAQWETESMMVSAR